MNPNPTLEQRISARLAALESERDAAFNKLEAEMMKQIAFQLRPIEGRIEELRALLGTQNEENQNGDTGT